MNLTELSSPDVAGLPVRALADHLRLGSGFSDDGTLDPLLVTLLEAAISAIEARTGKVLLSKTYSWDVTRWACWDRQGLPVGPVTEISALTLIDRAGTETIVAAEQYTLLRDLYRPEIRAGFLPTIPFDGIARLTFVAGFGSDWADVPADLQQAVMLLAAHFYEKRSEAGIGSAILPFGVQALIERYRTVRMLGAGA